MIPSFFAKGVPEYPAILLPEFENLPPGETHQTPDRDRYQRRNQAQAPPGSLRGIAGAEIYRRGSGAVVSERCTQIRKVGQREHAQIRRRSGGKYHNQKRHKHSRYVRGDAGKDVMGVEIDQKQRREREPPFPSGRQTGRRLGEFLRNSCLAQRLSHTNEAAVPDEHTPGCLFS